MKDYVEAKINIPTPNDKNGARFDVIRILSEVSIDASISLDDELEVNSGIHSFGHVFADIRYKGKIIKRIETHISEL